MKDHISENLQLQRVLGEGSFGQVWLAVEETTGQSFALKVMKPEGWARSIQKEFIIHSSLQHQRIVKLYGFSFKNNVLFLKLELMHSDLHALISNNSLSLRSKRRIVRQLLQAVAFIHERGITHGDIKPSNVLSDKDHNIKLSDFGSARLISDKTNFLRGTLRYQSLESLAEESAGKACDIWSAGCVILQLYLGRPLFRGKSRLHLIKQIKNFSKTLKDSTQIFKDLPLNLVGLLLSIFQINPARRPSARQLLKHSFFEQEPTTRQSRQRGQSLLLREYQSLVSRPKSRLLSFK